jgi:hypothetical protein
MSCSRWGCRSSLYVRFTDEIVESMSPVRHRARWEIPVVPAHESCETKEFSAALGAAGKSVRRLPAE